MPHNAQVSRYAAVRHRINAVACGTPLVDEEVVNPVLGRPGTGKIRWNEHLGLLKSHFAKVVHVWVSQSAQFVALSIVVPMLHEGVTVQQSEENFTHFPTTATVVPTLGSNPHPYYVVHV